MKSIYAKLIFGFLVTIIFSFSVTGYIAVRSNYSQIESNVQEELESTGDFVCGLIENVPDDKIDHTLQEYALSSENTVVCYSMDNGYHVYGKKSNAVSKEKIAEYFLKDNNDEKVYVNKHNILSYGHLRHIKNKDYYIFVQKDMSRDKNSFISSAVLILGCIFLSGSVVFLAVADIIVKPITRLTKATKELSKGNYNVRVDCVGTDELSRLNQGFNQMAQQLAKQDETRQKFISDVSHEFQTPLTSIQGFANILKEEDLPKEQREKYLDIILFNSKRLSTLAKNMLQLTLLDREEITLEMTTFSLIDQINRVISLQESQASQKDIEIVFEKPKKDIFIVGDEQRLEQVWTNILSNAIKYTNQNGLITIMIKKTSKEVELTFEDTGIGMSKEVISHIFERFYREDKARSVDGNGLGLAIVKSIVDLHHGQIDVLSTVDVGTTFIVKLPIEKESLKERLSFNKS